MYILDMFRRRLGDGSSRDSSLTDDFSELNRAQNQAISMSQTLLVEIRQAVNEAQPKGKKSVYLRSTTIFASWNGLSFIYLIFS